VLGFCIFSGEQCRQLLQNLRDRGLEGVDGKTTTPGPCSSSPTAWKTVYSLMFYNLPAEWWQRVRTNIPMERLIGTLRMRLNPIRCFHDQPAVERAVFGQLARWHKIKLTHNT